MNLESELLLTLLDAIPDPVFAKDDEHRWIYGNKAFVEFIGLPREQFIGLSDYALFPKEQADVFWKKDQEVLDSQGSNENEEPILRPNGELRTILTKKTCLRLPSGKKIILGTIRDITERKVQEQMLLKFSEIASLGEMAGVVAHEINNPLAIIMGRTFQLRKHLESPERPALEKLFELLNQIDNTTIRISKLIKNWTQASDRIKKENALENSEKQLPKKTDN